MALRVINLEVCFTLIIIDFVTCVQFACVDVRVDVAATFASKLRPYGAIQICLLFFYTLGSIPRVKNKC